MTIREYTLVDGDTGDILGTVKGTADSAFRVANFAANLNDMPVYIFHDVNGEARRYAKVFPNQVEH